VLTKHLNDVPPTMRAVFPDLQISNELEAVVQRALAKDPNHRFQTMNELAAALAATPEGQYAGIRGPYSQVGTDPRGSVIPGPSQNPTAQQFVGNPSVPQHVASGSGVVLTDAARAAVTMPRQPTGVEARAETQLGGEAATRPPVKTGGSAGLIFAGLGVLLVAGGAAAFFLRGGTEPPTVPSAQVRADQPPPVTPEPPPAVSSVAVVTPPPAPSAAVNEVKLEIVTDPPGAKVQKNGFQVCDATPCTVNATVNEQLEIAAQKDAMTGKAKVLAQKDQTVTLKLVAPVKQQSKPMKPQCEVQVGDLKILRDCP